MVAAAIGAIVLVVVVLAILNMTGVISIFKSRRKKHAKSREHKARGVDRRTDDEAPVPKPTPVPKQQIEKPKAPAPAEKTHTPQPQPWPADFFESQFAPLDQSQFDKQFATHSTDLSKKALSSQLKSDNLMPRFSSERQPTRQTGMPLDMVYSELRAENAPAVKTKMSTEQVPFGGSEFHEMRRAQTLGEWTDTFP